MDEIKIWAFNISAFTISLTAVADVLKILLIVASLGYTLSKWWRLMHSNKDK
jgi:hypothetical protein